MALYTRRAVAWCCLFFLLLIVCTFFVIDIEWVELSLEPPPSTVPVAEHCTQLPDAGIVETLDTTQEVVTAPIRRKHIVVASFFGFHFDVYMALAWTLRRVLAEVPDSKLDIFADPFYYGFQTIANDYDLYDGGRRSPMELVSYVQTNPTVDVIILGTCEIEYVSYVYHIDTNSRYTAWRR